MDPFFLTLCTNPVPGPFALPMAPQLSPAAESLFKTPTSWHIPSGLQFVEELFKQEIKDGAISPDFFYQRPERHCARGYCWTDRGPRPFPWSWPEVWSMKRKSLSFGGLKTVLFNILFRWSINKTMKRIKNDRKQRIAGRLLIINTENIKFSGGIGISP